MCGGDSPSEGQFYPVLRSDGNPSWYFEDWLVRTRHGETKADDLVRREPDRDADHRVHLHGGSGRSAGGRRLR